jgi:peptidoglycan/xylan/chitin deacetylase (PgdA/CDA1 family)
MRGTKDNVIKAMLDGLYWSGVYHLMASRTAGVGVIFMLHRVRAAPEKGAFAPNAALEVTPDFLDQTLHLMKDRGVEIVDLDEAAERLCSGAKSRFAVFTFDDGYADNLDAALPVFEAHNAPFTIYVATGLIDGTADIWWLMLEEAIAGLKSIRTQIGGRDFELRADSAAEKQAAWDAIYWPLRELSIAGRRGAVTALAEQAGADKREIFGGLAPTWERVRKAAAHPLVRIGAHTLSHPPLRALSDDDARHEIFESRRRIEAQIGRPVSHFAYPFGDRDSAGPRDFALAHEAGFLTAVTTRRGPLFPAHAEHLHALPRVSLNGNYQATRYVDLFLSGAPFALWNRGNILDVA